MDMLKIGTYTAPTDTLTQYDVKYSKSYGAEEELENGYTYTEQVRAGIPIITVAWTNITADTANAIINAVSAGQFDVTYYFGGSKTAKMRLSQDVKLQLGSNINGVMYFNLSMTMEG